MRRLKTGWVLVAVTVVALATGLAIVYRDRARDVKTERSSRRTLSISQKRPVEKQPETSATVKQLVPVFPGVGLGAGAEDPKIQKQPIRIKTH